MTRSVSWGMSSHGHQKSLAAPPSTTSRATSRTRTRLPSIAAAVGIALVSARSPYDEPARWEPDEIVDGVPAIDWPLGAPNMSDEWVAALYKADAAHIAAQNAHDFSNPALKELFEDDHLMLLARPHPGHGRRRQLVVRESRCLRSLRGETRVLRSCTSLRPGRVGRRLPGTRRSADPRSAGANA